MNVSKQEKKECSGCKACLTVCPLHCITMAEDQEGFSYPLVNQNKCIECGKCVKVCPFENPIQMERFPNVYACFAKDKNIRYDSSSGGLFSILAQEILDNHGVLCGVILEEGTLKVKHTIIENVNELKYMRGSKYVESDLSDVFIQILDYLNNGRYVLFTGTPCQVAGLKSFLRKDFNNLICVEIICHGVPSKKLWKKYVEYTEDKENKVVKSVLFRSKKYSWNDFGIKTEYDEECSKFQFSFENPYFRMFNSNLCLRPSCYNCKAKGLNSKADISLGDFWNIERYMPELDDGNGISLVLVNTSKGKTIFDRIRKNVKCYSDNLSYEKACDCNPAIYKSIEISEIRSEFYNDLDALPFDKLIKKYVPMPLKYRIKKYILQMEIFRKLHGGGHNYCYGFVIIFSLDLKNRKMDKKFRIIHCDTWIRWKEH